MNRHHLVLGANGHLGYNLLQLLLEKGERVGAAVRSDEAARCLAGLNCPVVRADLRDRRSLAAVMEGVDVLYVVAGVYRSWARDIEEEIVKVNIEGTRNVLEAAAECGVGRLIYVSTAHALDLRRSPLDETTWNEDYADPYRRSKTEAEKLAWKLAKQHGLWMVSVLPAGMVGPGVCGRLTPTMEALAQLLSNKIPINLGFNMNIVDVRDVAAAMIAAAEKGRNGERYLLAQERQTGMDRLFSLAHSLYPAVRIPHRLPAFMLYAMAGMMEAIGGLTGKPPVMQRAQLRTMRSSMNCDTTKAVKELGFVPRSAEEALRETFAYLMNDYRPRVFASETAIKGRP